MGGTVTGPRLVMGRGGGATWMRNPLKGWAVRKPVPDRVMVLSAPGVDSGPTCP